MTETQIKEMINKALGHQATIEEYEEFHDYIANAMEDSDVTTADIEQAIKDAISDCFFTCPECGETYLRTADKDEHYNEFTGCCTECTPWKCDDSDAYWENAQCEAEMGY